MIRLKAILPTIIFVDDPEVRQFSCLELSFLDECQAQKLSTSSKFHSPVN